MPEKRPKLDQAWTASGPTTHRDHREAQRRERVERLLSGQLRRLIKPMSKLMFDFEQATRIARRGNSTPIT